MRNLNKLLDLMKVEKIVTADNIYLNNEINTQIENISDIRTATFYAFGKKGVSNENVALIIDGNFIENTYTALTEAWFQNSNIIVIALYNSIYDINARYLDRCSGCNLTMFLNDIEKLEDKIVKSLKTIGPKIYNIVVDWDISEKENDYSIVLNTLKEIVNVKDEIYVYNSKSTENTINIGYRYKYGIFSKYVAYLLEPVEENKILICTSDCFKLDSNILNTRYLSDKFKVIIVEKNENFESIKDWCNGNKIQFNIAKDLSNDLKNLYISEVPTILLVKGGEK